MESITIKKMIPGSLFIQLHDINNPIAQFKLNYTPRTTQKNVPVNVALSILTDPVLNRMYKDGAFSIVNESFFLEKAAEAQLLFDEKVVENKESNKKTIVKNTRGESEAEITKFIKNSSPLALENRLKSLKTTHDRDKYVSAAQQHFESLTNAQIKAFEKVLSVDVTLVDV